MERPGLDALGEPPELGVLAVPVPPGGHVPCAVPLDKRSAQDTEGELEATLDVRHRQCGRSTLAEHSDARRQHGRQSRCRVDAEAGGIRIDFRRILMDSVPGLASLGAAAFSSWGHAAAAALWTQLPASEAAAAAVVTLFGLILLILSTAVGFLLNGISFFLLELVAVWVQRRMALGRWGLAGRIMEQLYSVERLPIISAFKGEFRQGANVEWAALGSVAERFLLSQCGDDPEVVEMRNARALAIMTRSLSLVSLFATASVVSWRGLACQVLVIGGLSSMLFVALTGAIAAYCDIECVRLVALFRPDLARHRSYVGYFDAVATAISDSRQQNNVSLLEIAEK